MLCILIIFTSNQIKQKKKKKKKKNNNNNNNRDLSHNIISTISSKISNLTSLVGL